MPGLKYVGADYTEDNNNNDTLTKADVDAEFSGATVSQAAVQAAINSSVSAMASSTYVNNALTAFIQPTFLNTTNSYTLAITSGPLTAGTYTLTYGGQTTAAIAWNAPASAIKSALTGLSNLTNITVSGQVGGPYLITLQVTTQGILSADDIAVSNGTISVSVSNMLPTGWSGQFVAPLVSTKIPSKNVPSLGYGYVLGPYGCTATFAATNAGSTPTKIADFVIGPTGISHQPMAFMSLLVSGVNGARPVVDICISAGQQQYTNQTLIARGMGRDCWNDLQAITVLSVPSIPGHTGLANTGYSPTYSAWVTAWVYDANGQGVSVNTNNIVNAGVWFWRYQQ